MSERKRQLVVVGNGMVGHKFIETLAGTDDFAITVLSEEPRLAYDRVHLSNYFDSPRPDLSLTSAEDYAAWGVKVIFERALEIDRRTKTIRTASQIIPYDKLVLATGSRPFVPPIEGAELEGCFVYRTIEDLERIEAYAKLSQSGAIIGGGLLGLEAAGALRKLGLATHVIEVAPHLMPLQLDEIGGRFLKRIIEAMGIEVRTGAMAQRIIARDGRAAGIVFADGSMLEADLVIFSAGIRPRDELARAAGLEIGPRGGIAIDDHCRTSDPDIYAIGECASHNGIIYGLVAPGYAMAKALAAHLAGDGTARFAGTDLSTKLKLLGVEVASFGDAHARSPEAEEIWFADPLEGIYKKLVVSRDGKRLFGGILVGDAAEYNRLLALWQSRAPLPQNPRQLILPQDGTEKGAELPAEARICNCENVPKASIVEAIKAGARELAELKRCTKAGTGCGGCVPTITEILKAELARLGERVANHLCEHFAYSRQELFDIVRVKGYRTFEELLRDYGRGYGCEICKPAIASILASIHNEYILKDELAPLQDTNDRFLANMQKDGTYSIVPRVPGGEITPDKLIVLGQVAKKYNLYCKITGGQRVDLFGARLEQLPSIWKELIEAGFESGHAYGKALRTVKSCVGQTWCRYGVQDSTSLAIRLENRYKGLRAPHKIKGAVSGCTRDCAEMNNKDFGVVATEKGWNLFVCGNGGMRPAHAQLLAADLDEETLIRYLDRFIMFYIRTADRLQRTSTWLAKLEGGIEYLRRVIIDDALGLAAELEAMMQHHIATYRCEWKATLEDPEKLKQFRHFINSDDPDDNVVVVIERGQPRPATLAEKARSLPVLTNF
jgi:nitrite reductase (NADH) large subunit